MQGGFFPLLLNELKSAYNKLSGFLPSAAHFRAWVHLVSPPFPLRWLCQVGRPSWMCSVSHFMVNGKPWCSRGGGLACDVPELNVVAFLGIFWPALIHAYPFFLGPYFASFLTVQCYQFQWDFSVCLSAGRGAAELDFKWSRTAAFAKLNPLLPCICTSLINSSHFSSWVEGGCGCGKW